MAKGKTRHDQLLAACKRFLAAWEAWKRSDDMTPVCDTPLPDRVRELAAVVAKVEAN
jgi:hypothetical protein